jgi:hypothetical protein
MTTQLFGAYNSVAIALTDGRFSAIVDRVHRKRPVAFVEVELEDLGNSPREKPSLGLESPFQAGTRFTERTVGNESFRVSGESQYLSQGFARNFRCSAVEGATASCEVLLTISIPHHSRYCIDWECLTRSGDSFDLDQGLTLRVLSEHEWEYKDGRFTIEAGEDDCSFGFLVKSLVPSSDLRRVALVVERGAELDGVIVRAALGQGFVPCFVLDHDANLDDLNSLLEDIPHDKLIFVGLSDLAACQEGAIQIPLGVRDSSVVAPLIGNAIPESTITVASKSESLANGLLFAVKQGCGLRVDDEVEQEEQHSIGTMLDAKSASEAPHGADEELVICEATSDDLLICQGIGYAQLRGCKIAFISEIHDTLPRSFSKLSDLATRLVPEQIRSPDVSKVTVLTKAIPLHLVRCVEPQQACWMHRYIVSHLPAQTASSLVPRFLQTKAAPSPDTPFAVVFDALSGALATEGREYDKQLETGLAHSIYLSGDAARGEVLKEAVQRYPLDLLLIVSQGRTTTS